MKKAIAWLLVIAMTAALAIGGTLAYLTDTDEDVNVMTVGEVKIDQLEYERENPETNGDDAEVQEFHDNKPLYPAVTKEDFDWDTTDGTVDWDQIGKDGYESGIWNPERINNEVDKMVFVRNEGDFDAYVRTVFAFEAGNYTTLDEFRSKVHLNLNDTNWTWEWVQTPITIGGADYFVATATYHDILEPGALTEISLSQIALDPSATNEDVAGFGDTYQILVQSQAVQADGFDGAVFALDEAFGTIPPAPFDGDSATKGTDLRTALHYLDGGTTDISNRINSITFGLTSAYADIAAENEGALVDVEQDVPAYAYYVDNGTGYDIYCLSSGDIYAPEDSSYLLKGMSALTQLNTANLDFSRVVLLNSFFSNCTALTNVDVSGWDVSGVTTLDRLFYCCKGLVNITGLGTWDTSSVTSFFGSFYTCTSLASVEGIGSWNTGNVNTMAHCFRGCISLTELDVANWDVSNVTAFNSMFCGNGSNAMDMKLLALDLSKWNPTSAVHLNHMFYGCAKITELDLSDWYMPDLYTTSHMFADCTGLKVIDVSGWYTPNWYSMDAMFNDCRSVEFLDVSSFTTDNVVEFSQAFESCYSLESIKGLENWNTANGKSFDETFLNCRSLKELNLSNFDTRNAQYGNKHLNGDISYGFKAAFNGMNSLEKLILGENFSFVGNGTVKPEHYAKLPAPAAIDGATTKWYNAENGTYYAANEIPEKTAATYVAAVEP